MGSVVSSSVPVEPNKLSAKFWDDGAAKIQQQAKSMSQQFLNSKPVADNSSLSGITSWLERMTNQSRQYNNELYERQLRDGQYNQQQVASDKLSTDRTAFERQQSLNQQNFNNQSRLISQEKGGFSVGGFSGVKSYGQQGQLSTSRDQNLTSTGLRAGLYNPSIASEWLDTQRTNAQSAKMFSEANVAGQSKLQREQYDYQKGLANLNNRNAIDLLSRQTSIDAQQKANDYLRQSQESAAERVSRERQVAMQAQGNMYSAMFNSLSTRPGDYQYWGGRV